MREFTNLFSLHVIICMTWIAIITFSRAQVYPWVFVLLFFLIAVGIYILARLFSWRVFLLYFCGSCLFVSCMAIIGYYSCTCHKSTVDAIVVVKDYSQAKRNLFKCQLKLCGYAKEHNIALQNAHALLAVFDMSLNLRRA